MNTILKLGPNSVVSQPGDPLLSPNGNVSVRVNNDGTASLTRPVTGGGTETRGLVIAPPYDAEIEYLESTGTQYIDTGIRGAGSGYFATGFCPLTVSNTSTYWRYFGASNGVNPTDRTIAVYIHSLQAVTYEDGTSITTLGALGNVYEIPKHAYSCPEGTEIGDTNFQIFGYNGATNIGCARFYYFKLWNSSGVLVRDFIPVRVGTTGYLYDRVSGTLFGNAGTGDFVRGNDIYVQNALVTANMNFDNIKHWFTNATFSVKPTVTFKSGWSASSDIEFRIVNGRMAHVAGNIKCTSALTAGTSYSPFTAFSFPSGVGYYAGCRLGASQRVWIYFNGTSTIVIPEVNIDANTNIYLRGLIPMTLTPGTATSYVKNIAPLF